MSEQKPDVQVNVGDQAGASGDQAGASVPPQDKGPEAVAGAAAEGAASGATEAASGGE